MRFLVDECTGPIVANPDIARIVSAVDVFKSRCSCRPFRRNRGYTKCSNDQREWQTTTPFRNSGTKGCPTGQQ